MFFPCCSCTVPMVLQVFLTCPQGLIGKKRGAVYDIEDLMVVTLVNDHLWFRVLPRWRFSSDLFMRSEKSVFSLTRCVSKFRCSFAVSLHWSLGTPPLSSIAKPWRTAVNRGVARTNCEEGKFLMQSMQHQLFQYATVWSMYLILLGTLPRTWIPAFFRQKTVVHLALPRMQGGLRPSKKSWPRQPITNKYQKISKNINTKVNL